MSWRVVAVLAVVTVVGGLLAGTAYCQQGGGGGRGGAGGRGRFDPEQMRQQRAERMREALGATDEEWQVLEPLVQKVQTLSAQARVGGGGMRMRRRGGADAAGGGGRGGPGAEEPQSELQQAQSALQETLANTNASAADISAKLKVLREAREKARQELDVAQKELREVITLRQEAQLVLMGLLD